MTRITDKLEELMELGGTKRILPFSLYPASPLS